MGFYERITGKDRGGQCDVCEECGKRVKIGDFPFCPHDSTRPVGRFKECDVEIDGVVHRISSIQDANRIEKEYAQRARSDPSVSPISFRAFHQDASNQDANCFGPSPQQELSRQANLHPRRHGRREPDAPLHPAVKRIYERKG